jgi:acyl-CoA thioesterase FadM
MGDVLQRRADALAEQLDGLEAAMAAEAERGLPRITRLETEYLRAVTAAELEWVRTVVEDLRAGRLAWSKEQLDALAAGPVQQ